jgi:hypothetical protein
MSRRPASITQADVSRCGRAAKQLGPEWYIEVDASTGIIRVMQSPSPSDRPSPGREPQAALAPEHNWRL